MPAIAGATALPYRRCLICNAIGGTLWAVNVVVTAYLAGVSWQRVQTYLGTAGLVGGGVLAAVIAVAVVLRRRRGSQLVGSGSRM